MISFSDRLTRALATKQTPVLVGLDPRWDMLPSGFTQGLDAGNPEVVADVFERFCRDVIDIVASLVPAVKPQSAFFEQYGPWGMMALQRVIAYAQSKGLLVIFDGKRNDIGSTAAAYAAGLLGPGASPWGADALTVSPYLGGDSLTPFIETARQRGAGIFILVKTSNPGGALFQDLLVMSSEESEEDENQTFRPLYRVVGDYVNSLARESRCMTSSFINNRYGDVGAVVGATWPEQLAELRASLDHTWFLVPGFGSQGGGVADVAGAFDHEGLGALINSSRGIIFAHRNLKFSQTCGDSRWENAVDAATRDMIDALATETLAGRLSRLHLH